MTTWSEQRTRTVDNRPRRWICHDAWPPISDATWLEAANWTLVNYLNLLGWPVSNLPILSPWHEHGEAARDAEVAALMREYHERQAAPQVDA